MMPPLEYREFVIRWDEPSFLGDCYQVVVHSRSHNRVAVLSSMSFDGAIAKAVAYVDKILDAPCDKTD
jgi:hypothetical protein